MGNLQNLKNIRKGFELNAGKNYCPRIGDLSSMLMPSILFYQQPQIVEKIQSMAAKIVKADRHFSNNFAVMNKVIK